MNDSQRLSHTKWNCKYHIVFAPKFRCTEIYLKIRNVKGENALSAFYGNPIKACL